MGSPQQSSLIFAILILVYNKTELKCIWTFSNFSTAMLHISEKVAFSKRWQKRHMAARVLKKCRDDLQGIESWYLCCSGYFLSWGTSISNSLEEVVGCRRIISLPHGIEGAPGKQSKASQSGKGGGRQAGVCEGTGQ